MTRTIFVAAILFSISGMPVFAADVQQDSTMMQQLQADLSAMGTSQHHAMEDLGTLVQAYQKGQADLAEDEAQKAELIKWLQDAQAAAPAPVKGAP